MATINRARIRHDLSLDRKRLDTQRSNHLRLAVVRRVDYEAMTVDLMAVGQGNEDQYLSVPLTFPGAGRRTFMGVMPEVHDNCIIGFAPRESDHFKNPYIIAWVVPGTLSGYNWMTTATHAPDELASDPATKFQLEGVFGQIRHKLRHLAPGNAFISSSQGSDLVLDESALLVNRRGNEVLLRDQDQALVVRTLQQFHAGAGFRVYGGMVQRDGRLLLRSLIGDGKNWTGPKQVDAEGKTLTPGLLPKSELPVGTILADPVFDADSGVTFPSLINPYSQLERGRFTNGRIRFTGIPSTSDAVSGGKPLYRVGLADPDGSTGAAATNTGIPALTEYRIEVVHTTDGTLPVTEQTDGFDAERIPDGTNSTESPNDPVVQNSAFVEFVLGTAVENNLMSPLYGLPITTQIFSEDNIAPAVFSAEGVGVIDQLAVFLRVKDPTSASGSQSFVSITKGGFWRSALAGGEHLYTGDYTLAVQGSTTYSFQQAFVINAVEGRDADNVGISLSSDGGAVVISAGGSTTAGRETSVENGTESNLPGLVLNSQTNTLVQAQRQITVSAPTISLQDAGIVQVRTSSTFAVNSGGAASLTAKTISVTSTGRAEYTYGGPLEGQSTNAPLRLTKFTAQPSTGFVGGTADEYSIQYGDLVEKINIGNRKTTVTTGDILFEAKNGTAEMKSGQNTVTLESSGISVTAKQGPVNIKSSTDAMTLQATRTLLLKSKQQAEINAPRISFAVTGADYPGGVLTDGCIDGLTGQPFKNGGTFGSNQVRMTTATT